MPATVGAVAPQHAIVKVWVIACLRLEFEQPVSLHFLNRIVTIETLYCDTHKT